MLPNASPRLALVCAVGLLGMLGVAWLAHHQEQVRDDRSSTSRYAPSLLQSPTPRAGDVERWARRTAARSGVPQVALRAYARAARKAPASCRLGWTTLAGIGSIESRHGTLGGRTLGDDARSSTPILGPALDGHGAYAAIPATRVGTAWHGDTRWEHAVGPMQFLPSTWRTWGADADGDGAADPADLDDAAYAAAGYLCADGRDLSTGEGWAEAVLSYNNSQAYADDVYATAMGYADHTS